MRNKQLLGSLWVHPKSSLSFEKDKKWLCSRESRLHFGQVISIGIFKQLRWLLEASKWTYSGESTHGTTSEVTGNPSEQWSCSTNSKKKIHKIILLYFLKLTTQKKSSKNKDLLKFKKKTVMCNIYTLLDGIMHCQETADIVTNNGAEAKYFTTVSVLRLMFILKLAGRMSVSRWNTQIPRCHHVYIYSQRSRKNIKWEKGMNRDRENWRDNWVLGM